MPTSAPPARAVATPACASVVKSPMPQSPSRRNAYRCVARPKRRAPAASAGGRWHARGATITRHAVDASSSRCSVWTPAGNGGSATRRRDTLRPSAATATSHGKASRTTAMTSLPPSSRARRSHRRDRGSLSMASASVAGLSSCATTVAGSARASRSAARVARWSRASPSVRVGKPIAASSARLVSSPTACRSPETSHHSDAMPAACATRSSIGGWTTVARRRTTTPAGSAASASTSSDRGAATHAPAAPGSAPGCAVSMQRRHT